jgi:hypothetical protein
MSSLLDVLGKVEKPKPLPTVQEAFGNIASIGVGGDPSPSFQALTEGIGRIFPITGPLISIMTEANNFYAGAANGLFKKLFPANPLFKSFGDIKLMDYTKAANIHGPLSSIAGAADRGR